MEPEKDDAPNYWPQIAKMMLGYLDWRPTDRVPWKKATLFSKTFCLTRHDRALNHDPRIM